MRQSRCPHSRADQLFDFDNLNYFVCRRCGRLLVWIRDRFCFADPVIDYRGSIVGLYLTTPKEEREDVENMAKVSAGIRRNRSRRNYRRRRNTVAQTLVVDSVVQQK